MQRRFAGVNVKLLVILGITMLFLGIGGVWAIRVRRQTIADHALAVGREALEAEDWSRAAKNLKIYLEKRPDDVEVLEQFAKANLSVRPRTEAEVFSAIAGYRRLLGIKPGDDAICQKLADLYIKVGEFGEAAYVCRQRLESEPSDPDAALMLGSALAAQRMHDEAATVLEALLKEHPDQVVAYDLLGKLTLPKDPSQEKAKGMEWLDRGVAANPESSEAWVRRARFFRLVRNDRAAATADLEKAETLSLSDPNVRLALAEEWLKLGNYDRESVHERFLETLGDAALEAFDIHPPDMALALWTLKGHSSLRQGDGERARELADRGLAELEGTQKTAFIPLATELYVVGERLDQARVCLEDYREILDQAGPVSESFAHDATFLESLVESAEGDHYNAIAELESLIVMSPTHLRARALLATCYMATKQWRRAAQSFRDYLEAAPNDANATLQYAESCRMANDVRGFLPAARSAEKLMPHNMRAKWLRIGAEIKSLMRGEGDKAKLDLLAEELKALSMPQGDKAQFSLLQARVANLRGHRDEALGILQEAAGKGEDGLPILLEIAGLYADGNQKDRAIETCRQACTRHGNLAEPRILLAKLQAGADRVEEAVETLNAAVSELESDEKLKAQLSLAQLQIEKTDRPAGVSLLRQLADEHPQNMELRTALLRLPEVRGDAENAQGWVDELRAIEGEGGIRWQVEQANLWMQQDGWEPKTEQMETMLRRCMAADPRWEPPALVLGSLLERMGNDAEAERAYLQAIDANPMAAGIAERLIDLLLRRKKFADVDALLQRVQADTPVLRNRRIESTFRRGEYALTADELRKKVTADPKDAHARVMLAQIIYGTEGQADEALALLDEARTIDPERHEVITTRARIIHLDRGPAEAEKFLTEEISRRGDFVSYLSRAGYYAGTGRLEEAERDYVRLTSLPEASARGYRELGAFLYSQGWFDRAVQACEEGLGKHPDSPEIQRLLVEVLVSSAASTDRQRADEMLDALLEQFPDDPKLLYFRATMLLAQNTREALGQAREVLERVIDLDPHHVAAHLKLIQLARRHDPIAAIDQLLMRASTANPNEPVLDLAYAQIELQRGNLPLAREFALRVQEKLPRNAAPKVVLAGIALNSGDVQLANTKIDEAVRLDPANEQVQIMRSGILLASGKHDEAIRILEAYLESRSPRRPVDVLLGLGKACRLKGDTTTAERYLAEAAEIEPNRVDIVSEKIDCLAAQDRFEDIVAETESWLAERAGESAVVLRAGPILAATEKEQWIRVAERWYGLVSPEDPGFVQAQLDLGTIAIQRGDFANAITAYRRILDKTPNHRQALNNLAWILGMKNDEVEEGLAMAGRGLAQYPDDPHLLDTRGSLLLEAGRLTEAQRDLESCIRAAADIPATRAGALFRLGRVHVKRDEPAKARQRFEEALSVDREFNVLTDDQKEEIARHLKALPATENESR